MEEDKFLKIAELKNKREKIYDCASTSNTHLKIELKSY